jgi:hypothetical protein
MMHLTRQIGRYRHFRTIAEIVGAAVLLGSGATAAAAVLPSASSTTVHGCENSKTGALSVQLKSSCPAGTKALSWNTTGPRGPAGTTGIFGAKTNAARAGEAPNSSCYVGQILLNAGVTSPPGTLTASGQTLLISNFQALFSLLGNEYGGNGIKYFKLPDLRKSAPDGLTYSICVGGIFPPES